MAAHAKLSASSAHRWLTCTPSVRLAEQFPETTSEFAKEGTLAHHIGELKLARLVYPSMSKSEYTKKLNELKKHELYKPEMLGYTDEYFDYVNNLAMSFSSPPFITIEKRVDFSAYVPEGFGTSDCIVISGDTLYVIDLKYGKGVPVEAKNNPQAMLYGLGAYLAYKFLYPIKVISMVIVQPRLNNISEFTSTTDALLQWGESIKPIAQLAWDGQGEFNPGEKQCKFCPARVKCVARANLYPPAKDFKIDKPELLTNAEIGKILVELQGFDKWVKSLQEYALTECLKGNVVNGWKAVEGRGSRGYTDIDEAFTHLQANGIDGAMLYEKVPLTAPKLEKALGKKEFNALVGDYVVKYPGKPTLALATDKRSEFNSASSDFKN